MAMERCRQGKMVRTMKKPVHYTWGVRDNPRENAIQWKVCLAEELHDVINQIDLNAILAALDKINCLEKATNMKTFWTQCKIHPGMGTTQPVRPFFMLKG
eukprot:3071481-Amphidinium_carterae.1